MSESGWIAQRIIAPAVAARRHATPVCNAGNSAEITRFEGEIETEGAGGRVAQALNELPDRSRRVHRIPADPYMREYEGQVRFRFQHRAGDLIGIARHVLREPAMDLDSARIVLGGRKLVPRFGVECRPAVTAVARTACERESRLSRKNPSTSYSRRVLSSVEYEPPPPRAN